MKGSNTHDLKFGLVVTELVFIFSLHNFDRIFLEKRENRVNILFYTFVKCNAIFFNRLMKSRLIICIGRKYAERTKK